MKGRYFVLLIAALMGLAFWTLKNLRPARDEAPPNIQRPVDPTPWPQNDPVNPEGAHPKPTRPSFQNDTLESSSAKPVPSKNGGMGLIEPGVGDAVPLTTIAMINENPHQDRLAMRLLYASSPRQWIVQLELDGVAVENSQFALEYVNGGWQIIQGRMLKLPPSIPRFPKVSLKDFTGAIEQAKESNSQFEIINESKEWQYSSTGDFLPCVTMTARFRDRQDIAQQKVFCIDAESGEIRKTKEDIRR